MLFLYQLSLLCLNRIENFELALSRFLNAKDLFAESAYFLLLWHFKAFGSGAGSTPSRRGLTSIREAKSLEPEQTGQETSSFEMVRSDVFQASGVPSFFSEVHPRAQEGQVRSTPSR